jgi:hypothetical protein
MAAAAKTSTNTRDRIREMGILPQRLTKNRYLFLILVISYSPYKTRKNWIG